MLVELDLDALEEHIRKWKGPLILAGDFNAKARAWAGEPWGPRDDLLEEMMVAYNLVVANHPAIYISGSHKKHLILGGVRRRVTQRSPICIDETPREAEPTDKIQNERRMVPPKDEPRQIPTAN